MNLLENYIKSEIADIHKNNLIFRVIGKKEYLSNTLMILIEHAESLTKNNTGMCLNICIDYGGKIDILSATKKIAKKVQSGEINVNEIDTNIFRKNLISRDIDDLDLLIRTSGETRLSNFMLWQIAYTEIFFTETLWPDFTVIEFNNAIEFFKNRDRRSGSSNVFLKK